MVLHFTYIPLYISKLYQHTLYMLVIYPKQSTHLLIDVGEDGGQLPHVILHNLHDARELVGLCHSSTHMLLRAKNMEHLPHDNQLMTPVPMQLHTIGQAIV